VVRVFLLSTFLLAGCQLADSWLNPTIPPRIELVDPQIGVSYPFTVHTHCGLDDATIDGETWLFAGEPGANPPPGFMNPVDAGVIVLLDEDHAVYTRSGGVEARLTRGGVPRIGEGCV
jgi:hypothetical protein